MNYRLVPDFSKCLSFVVFVASIIADSSWENASLSNFWVCQRFSKSSFSSLSSLKASNSFFLIASFSSSICLAFFSWTFMYFDYFNLSKYDLHLSSSLIIMFLLDHFVFTTNSLNSFTFSSSFFSCILRYLAFFLFELWMIFHLCFMFYKRD